MAIDRQIDGRLLALEELRDGGGLRAAASVSTEAKEHVNKLVLALANINLDMLGAVELHR